MPRIRPKAFVSGGSTRSCRWTAGSWKRPWNNWYGTASSSTHRRCIATRSIGVPEAHDDFAELSMSLQNNLRRTRHYVDPIASRGIRS